MFQAFLPQKASEAEVTEESLLDAIEERDVLGAMETYKALKSQGKNVEQSVKQSLLELVCFYNSQERPDSHHLEQKWLEGFLGKAGAVVKNKNKWDAEGFAKSLFEEMDSDCPMAISAMILGMLKYGEYEKGLELYNSAVQGNVKLSVGVYNSLISECTSFLLNKRVVLDFVMKKLREMSQADVKPDLGTLNAALKSLSKVHRHGTVLKLMREFENMEILPSLGSYGYLLLTFSRVYKLENSEASSREAVEDIMQCVEKGEHEILHPSDLSFFNNAMGSFVEGFADADWALRLANIYIKPANRKFIVRAVDEHAFFKQLFLIVFENKPIDEAMDIYRKFAFTTFVPESRVVTAMIAAIHANLVPDYLVELWKDFEKLGFSRNRMLLGRLLDLMEDMTDEASLKVFQEVATQFCSKLDNFKTGDERVIPKVLVAFVKNDDEQGVSQVVDFLKKDGLFLEAFPESSVLILFDYAMSKKSVPLILDALSIACDKEFPSIGEMAERALPLLSAEDEAWAMGLIPRGKEENRGTKEEEK